MDYCNVNGFYFYYIMFTFSLNCFKEFIIILSNAKPVLFLLN